ncbi:hypothetical protein G3A39_44040 [Paraburkholderia aspalathi]|nr:hypothetical protein [Paraburkholderia aspalathi]
MDWFATEFVNYISVLPVILSWPSLNKPSWSLANLTFDREELTAAAYSGLPIMALVISCLAAMVIGGPGAVAFPVPALLWCGLSYPVFPTSVLALLFGCWSLIVISAGYFPNSLGATDEMSLISIRLGTSLITLGSGLID